MGFNSRGKGCLSRFTWLFHFNDGRLYVRLSSTALWAEDGTTAITRRRVKKENRIIEILKEAKRIEKKIKGEGLTSAQKYKEKER